MIAKPRGRRPSSSAGVFVRGEGQFKTPDAHAWNKIPAAGARVPEGSLVRVPRGGQAFMGGRELPSNTVSRANKKGK